MLLSPGTAVAIRSLGFAGLLLRCSLELSCSGQWLQCWAEADQWDGVMLCWQLFRLLFQGRGFPVQSRAGGHNQLLSLQLHSPKS